MDTSPIANNLRRLRREAGWNQADLAAAAGLSRSGYRNLERGHSGEPRMASLRALAECLGVAVQDLLAPGAELSRVRFRSLKRLKSREWILDRVARWLRDFSELEAVTGEACALELEPLWKAFPDFGFGRIPEFAGHARAALGLGEREAVLDICGLLEARGIKILSQPLASDAFMGLSVGAEEPGGPAVVVNTWERLPVETWIFSAAHELGHLLMHLQAYDIAEQAEDEDQEREADRFASHFLMPEAAFRREWAETAGLSLLDRVFKVKRVFRVSWRTVVYRVAEDLPKEERPDLWARINRAHQKREGHPLLKHSEPQGIEAEIYDSLYAERPTGREPFQLSPYDFQEDRLARLVRIALEQGAITLSRAAEILGLSLSDMRKLTASWVA